jgi:hypothetical protein
MEKKTGGQTNVLGFVNPDPAPCPVASRFLTAIRSTSTSGSGNGTFSIATTLG